MTSTPDAPPGLLPDGLRIRRWRVLPSSDEIEADGQVVKLEPLHMRLLLALAARPGQVVTTQALLDEVWRDLVVTPASVYQAVAQLRRQLGDSAEEPAYIQTVHRKGYRLVAPVSVQEAAAPQLPAPVPPQAADPPSAAPAADAPAALVQPQRRRRGLLWLGAAVAAGVATAGAWWLHGRQGRSAPVRLAVLPFAADSADGDDPALARGLAQDVARALGRRTDLDVVDPDSLPGLAGIAVADTAALARRLGVQALVQGVLRREGTRLRLTVALHAVDQAVPAWQREFGEAADRVSQLPGVVADQLGTALALAPLPGAPAGRGGGASEAYEFYVLGSDAWRAKTPEAYARARQYFQRGIDADPAYARNYVGLGWTWLGQATTGAGLDLPRAIALATPLFQRALSLDPDSPEALTGQATLHNYAGERERARELLLRALALQPSQAQALTVLGLVEFEDGWPLRAAPYFERSAALKPMSASPLERLALCQVLAGRTDAAREAALAAVAREPDFPNGHWMLGVAAYGTGELADAVAGYRQALQREPRRPYLWYELARLRLDLEQPAEAAAAFARCVEMLPGAPWPPVHAAWAWLAADPRPADVPSALRQLPEDGSAAEWALMRLAAGLPVDTGPWQRVLDGVAARGEALVPSPWFVFQGSHRLLDLATAQQLLGGPDAAGRHLDQVSAQLDRLEQQGNRFHMLAFHRARVLALRGHHIAALDALDAAMKAGWRRGWWLRLDPAFTALRGVPRLRQLQDELARRVAAQRQRLGS